MEVTIGPELVLGVERAVPEAVVLRVSSQRSLAPALNGVRMEIFLGAPGFSNLSTDFGRPFNTSRDPKCEDHSKLFIRKGHVTSGASPQAPSQIRQLPYMAVVK